MDQTQLPQLGPFCPWSPPDADNWLECPDQVRNKRLYWPLSPALSFLSITLPILPLFSSPLVRGRSWAHWSLACLTAQTDHEQQLASVTLFCVLVSSVLLASTHAQRKSLAEKPQALPGSTSLQLCSPVQVAWFSKPVSLPEKGDLSCIPGGGFNNGNPCLVLPKCYTTWAATVPQSGLWGPSNGRTQNPLLARPLGLNHTCVLSPAFGKYFPRGSCISPGWPSLSAGLWSFWACLDSRKSPI